MTEQERVGAIIVAAGESRRMNGVDKMSAPLGGRPLLARAVQPFERSDLVSEIVLVVNAARLEEWRDFAGHESWRKLSHICPGGDRRQDSVAAGLRTIGHCDWVIVHDGARPLVTLELIEKGIEAARDTGSAVAAVPVKDTIKVAGDDRIVKETPPRRSLWMVQTPQVFRFDILEEAYHHACDDATDDASLVERLGGRVKLYMGSYENIKVTTPEDLVLAGLIWKKWQSESA